MPCPLARLDTRIDPGPLTVLQGVGLQPVEADASMPRKNVDNPVSQLSDRELQVGLLAGEGLTDKQIAERLKIGEATIHSYWQRLRKKINATTRTDAAVIILRHRLRDMETRSTETLLQLSLVVNHVPDFAIFTTNSEGLIDTWNPGVMNIFGYTEQEFLGKPFSIIFTEQQVQKGQDLEEMRIARETGVFRENQLHRRKDGSAFWAIGTLVSLVDEAGVFHGYGKVCTEQTRFNDLENRIAELERQRDNGG
jgi:PAS domain S-box-containing protein